MQDKYLFILNKLRKSYGNKELNSDQLKVIGTRIFGKQLFNGVFPWDLYNEKNGFSIINTDNSNGNGIHWVAIYQNNNKIYVYDSFGRYTTNILKEFHKKMTNKGYQVIDSKRDAEQSDYQADCGLRCIAWLYIVKKYGINKALLI